MESFIIKIYRYSPKHPEKLVGTIEGMVFQTPMAFSSQEELWQAIREEFARLEELPDPDLQ